MITGAHIKQGLQGVPGALGGQMKSLDELAAGANDALRQAPPGLTVQGAAAFLATMAQESAWFRTTVEYAKNGRYAPYIGRTFQQVTWRDNYRAFGKWCQARGMVVDPDHFVKSPWALEAYRWAWLGGVWYFEHAKLWDEANSGDFLGVQKGVNLGNPKSKYTPAGWSTRKRAYDAFCSVGDVLLPDPVDVVEPLPVPSPPVAIEPTPEHVGIWAVDPGQVQTVLLGRDAAGKTGNELSPATTIADGVGFVKNSVGRYALLRSDGWSYDRSFLVQVGAGPVPVTRQFPIIPDYDTTERIPFRGGKVCRCVAVSVPWVEFAMLEAGVIKWNLDFYQFGYRTDVAASAASHARGQMVDTGQDSDAALKIWRQLGWMMQRREVSQGFSDRHGHGGPLGCTHGSTTGPSNAKSQQTAWLNGRDGLRQNRAITGPSPKGKALPRWDDALSAYLKTIGAPPIPSTTGRDT